VLKKKRNAAILRTCGISQSPRHRSTMAYTCGLTLGKFAPLHAGHQLLIETARGETDDLVVVIYDAPEVTPIPLRVRADWVRRLYPSVQVVEASFDLAELPQQLSPRLPQRSIAGLPFGGGSFLAVAWLGKIILISLTVRPTPHCPAPPIAPPAW